MTGFMVVDGAAQHGLAIKGILLILILFTSCFPAYVLYVRIFPSVRTDLLVPFRSHECDSWRFKSPLSTNFSSKFAKTSARVSASAFCLSPPLPW